MHTEDPTATDVAQYRHLVDPLVGANVPASQSVHALLPDVEKDPAVQL